MKTTLNRVAQLYSGVAGGRRVLVALFEYVKPDGTALAAEEIETVLDAANAAATELGAEICWRATNGEIATSPLADDERVALELVATAVKISPDPIPEIDESELAPAVEETNETTFDGENENDASADASLETETTFDGENENDGNADAPSDEENENDANADA